MEPIKTPDTNMNFTSEAEEVLDLPARVERDEDGAPIIRSTWELTEIEREQVAEGAHVELGVWGSQPPPASLRVTAPWCPECNESMAWSPELRIFTCPAHSEDDPGADVT